MTLQQPGTGYRDASKATTIKALQDRAKQAAEFAAASTQIQQPIADPLQGISHLTGVLSGQVQQGRADANEADARQRLAGIMAGIDPEKGASMAQIAEMQQLDPDFANKIYEQMMADRQANLTREDDQSFRAGESQADRDARIAEQNARFGHEDKTAQTKVTTDENAAISANERADQDAIDAAKVAADEKMRQEAAAVAEQKRQETAAAEGKVTAIGNESQAREAEADRLGIPPGPQREEYILTGDISKVGNTYINGQEKSFDQTSGTKAAERLDSYIAEGAASKDFISQVRIVADLGKTVGTGKWAQAWNAAGPYIEAMGIDVSGLGESQAYQAITNKMAPQMRPAGSGATSNFDAKQFLGSLQSLGNSPEGNQIIEHTFEALAKNKMDAAEIASKVYSGEVNPATGQPWEWHEAEAAIRALPNPYDTFKAYQNGTATPPTNDGTTPPPPADAAGGGEYQPPVFDPATDKEGMTGEDEKGTWTVQGGKWVLTAPAGQ
jgi:hypothetical protein